jgi:hypothetical protein
MWWFKPIIPGRRRLKKEDHIFKDSLYIARLVSKKRKEKKEEKKEKEKYRL